VDFLVDEVGEPNKFLSLILEAFEIVGQILRDLRNVVELFVDFIFGNQSCIK